MAHMEFLYSEPRRSGWRLPNRFLGRCTKRSTHSALAVATAKGDMPSRRRPGWMCRLARVMPQSQTGINPHENGSRRKLPKDVTRFVLLVSWWSEKVSPLNPKPVSMGLLRFDRSALMIRAAFHFRSAQSARTQAVSCSLGLPHASPIDRANPSPPRKWGRRLSLCGSFLGVHQAHNFLVGKPIKAHPRDRTQHC